MCQAWTPPIGWLSALEISQRSLSQPRACKCRPAAWKPFPSRKPTAAFARALNAATMPCTCSSAFFGVAMMLSLLQGLARDLALLLIADEICFHG